MATHLRSPNTAAVTSVIFIIRKHELFLTSTVACRGCSKVLHFDALVGLSSLRDLALPAACQGKEVAEVRSVMTCRRCPSQPRLVLNA